MWGPASYPPPRRPLRALAVLVIAAYACLWLLFGPMTSTAIGMAVHGLQHAGDAKQPGDTLAGLLPGTHNPGADPVPRSKAAKAVRWALDQQGKPYQWGSAGPDAFDCSGLTSAAWAHAGVRIPRTAAGQLAGLPRVHGKRRPGDLIVYRSEGRSRRHVALVVAPGRMVEAAGEGSPTTVVAIRPGELGSVRPGGR
jgi:peptidoglycan DL-endopeptidase CwlO